MYNQKERGEGRVEGRAGRGRSGQMTAKKNISRRDSNSGPLDDMIGREGRVGGEWRGGCGEGRPREEMEERRERGREPERRRRQKEKLIDDPRQKR